MAKKLKWNLILMSLLYLALTPKEKHFIIPYGSRLKRYVGISDNLKKVKCPVINIIYRGLHS